MEQLEQAQVGLHGPVRLVQLGVGRPRALGPGVQPQVPRFPSALLGEPRVVGLPFLPPGGHGGQGTAHAEPVEDGAKLPLGGARPEQHGAHAHRARTRIVRPTSSSIDRSVS